MTSLTPLWQKGDIPPKRRCEYLVPSAVVISEALQIISMSQASVPGGKYSHRNAFHDVKGALVEECTECHRN